MDRDSILEELKAHLIRAQVKMEVIADRHRRNVQFNEGKLVM